MPFLDRTDEFFKIVDIKRSSTSSQEPIKKKPKKNQSLNTQIQYQRKFYETTNQLTKDLQKTAESLTKLAKLVKKRTPFDDNASHIQDLSLILKERLGEHKSTMNLLQKLIYEQQSQDNQVKQHSSNILSALESKLMYTGSKFQSILKSRSKHLKQQKERRNKFTVDKSQRLPQRSLQISLNSSNGNDGLNNINTSSTTSSSETVLQFGNEENGQQQQEQQQQISVVNQNDQYLRERSNEIKAIEKDVVVIGQMFEELAVMVKQQGELTQRIDDNVQETVIHVEQGQDELLKYLSTISSNRGLILKIFFVLLVFIMFMGVFVMR